MKPEWLRSILKAASSIRFTSHNSEWMTEAAKEESLAIADALTEIANHYINTTDGSRLTIDSTDRKFPLDF